MKDKLKMMLAMLIFGSLGIFIRNINLPSSAIAFVRGFVGALIIIIYCIITKRKISFKSIKKNWIFLLVSGAALGFNWMFLFEAYKYTSIANATLMYYLAPVFVAILSPFVFKEKMSVSKAVCIFLSLLGMAFVSGVFSSSDMQISKMGFAFGISAAIFYTIIVISNKFLKDISSVESTIVQLFVSAVVILPYLLCTEKISTFTLTSKELLLLLIVAVVHTGIAYLLYFGTITKLKAQTVAVYSYIDPVTAIILSALVLSEKMTILQIVGAALILGATLFSELYKSKKQLPASTINN
ncbi:MAG: DMT family transporter [Oscillospiraceae bacterium]